MLSKPAELSLPRDIERPHELLRLLPRTRRLPRRSKSRSISLLSLSVREQLLMSQQRNLVALESESKHDGLGKDELDETLDNVEDMLPL